MELKTPLFDHLEQIAFVVEDVYAAMQVFVDCGIGPWEILRFGDAHNGKTNFISIEDVVLESRPTGTYAIVNGVCVLPESGVELELIQPLCGESIFADYLRQHGPGLQHLSIHHGTFDEAMGRIEATGHGRTQQAAVDTTELCVFSDHRALIGTDLELHRRPEVFIKPDVETETYPEGGMPAGSRPLFTAFERLGIVVDDLDAALHLLRDEYGIGPWQVTESTPRNYVREGKPVDCPASRVAICETLNVALELIEPGEGETGEWALRQRGTDAHHLTLKPAVPAGELLGCMETAGHPVVQTMEVGGRRAALCDLRSTFGVCFEIMEE